MIDIEPKSISFDVTGAVEFGETCKLSAWLFLPPADVRWNKIVAFCLPGGTYTKAYFHQQIPGRQHYSAASMLAQHGIVTIAIDHLGTGGSTWPADGSKVTLEKMAAANAEAIKIARQQIGAGTLDPSLFPASQLFCIGLGHSLGGHLLHIQQAEFESYNAVGILGSTCLYIKGVFDPETSLRLTVPTPAEAPGYIFVHRAQNHGWFHYHDVPADVIEADDATITVLPTGMSDIAVPGRTAPYAARIKVPVILAFGEIDVSPNPREEPAKYSSCRDVTLYLQPRAAHCHNTASTRVRFWSRIIRWIDSIAHQPNS